MTQPTALEEFILKILTDNGITLSEETKADYMNRFLAEAEYRLGQAVAPKLSEQGAVRYQELLEDPNAGPEQLAAFWKQEVPEYETLVQQALTDFAAELTAALQS